MHFIVGGDVSAWSVDRKPSLMSLQSSCKGESPSAHFTADWEIRYSESLNIPC